MSLQHHLNADKVLAHSRESAHRKGRKSAHALMEREAGASDVHPSYGTNPIPKYHLPGKGGKSAWMARGFAVEMGRKGTGGVGV